MLPWHPFESEIVNLPDMKQKCNENLSELETKHVTWSTKQLTENCETKTGAIICNTICK